MAVAALIDKQWRMLAGGLSLGLCIFVEVIQGIGLLNGTGDVWDVFFEGIATMIAAFILAIYERKGNANETENN